MTMKEIDNRKAVREDLEYRLGRLVCGGALTPMQVKNVADFALQYFGTPKDSSKLDFEDLKPGKTYTFIEDGKTVVAIRTGLSSEKVAALVSTEGKTYNGRGWPEGCFQEVTATLTIE